MPIAIASFAGGRERLGVGGCLERLHVLPLELGVVAGVRLPEGRAEDPAVAERAAVDLRHELLDVVRVALGIGLRLVLNDCANHGASFDSGRA